MVISSLEISQFRNLRQASLTCCAGLNLITGANASGKTSLLEAIYFLGRGRSFRSRQPRELIHSDEGAVAFRIVAALRDWEGQRIPVGIERDAQTLTARIAGNPINSLAELAAQVPVLLINPDSHRLLEDGPQLRRSFMDWGLFHTKQSFMPLWKRYRSALRQRNAGLRTGLNGRGLEPWELELAAAAWGLDEQRRDFCHALEVLLTPLIKRTLGDALLTVDYRRGWPQQALQEVLQRDREQDRAHGYTRHGPHRADFVIRLNTRPATERLSRGQQKLLVMALVLAQAQFFQTQRNQPCILLIDDLPAELDPEHRTKIMACLADIKTQLFISAIEPNLLATTAWPEQREFILEGGKVREML